ncbi:MAG: alcohol dehydrogenase catalytic domain-containing protein [Verrucomicrobia bacterium]|nr:alcohol dehydrogenase catalytic domain-containing protein [Verrucomicrobiota bacterium]
MFVIPKTMRAVVYRGPNDLRVETVPVPRIQGGELLVKVAACGVCPTDIKKIQYGTVPPPRIFGHETAGTIVRVGARVKGFHIGDRVALHHHIPCLECHACRHHSFAQCARYKRTGITAGFESAGGGYAEYVRVMPFVLPGVVKIPSRNSFAEGAMLEPVNTILKAINRLNLLPGDTVLVAGQGPIGLMFTRLLRLRRVNVIASDLLNPRLQLAEKFGARWTFNAGKAEHPLTRLRHPLPRGGGEGWGEGAVRQSVPPRFVSEPDASGALTQLTKKITHGRGLDAAIIAVPSDAVAQQAMQLVRCGGQMLLFAHTRRGPPTAVDLTTVCVDEKDLLGSYSADFTLQKKVAQLVFSRRLDVRPLITHQFPLAQTAAAIDLAAHPTTESLKVLVGDDVRRL